MQTRYADREGAVPGDGLAMFDRSSLLSSYRSRGLQIAILIAVLAALPLAFAGGAQPASAQEGEEPTVLLYAGWNNVLYQGIPLPLPEALGDAAGDVSIVWEFDAAAQTWRLWSVDLPEALRTLSVLQPGGIYFLLSQTQRIWTQPLSAPPPAPTVEPPEPEPEPEPPAASGLWSLSFSRTTVLFTLNETIRFDESGQGIVASGQNAEEPMTVNAAQLAAIDQIMRGADFFAGWPAESRSGCTSCFRYSLTISAPSGASVSLETDDLGMSGDLFALIDRLTSVLIVALG